MNIKVNLNADKNVIMQIVSFLLIILMLLKFKRLDFEIFRKYKKNCKTSLLHQHCRLLVPIFS